MKSLLLGLSIIVLGAVPLSADLTLVQMVTGKGLGSGGGDGLQTTTYIKGTRMRAETADRVSILDVEKRQMIALDQKKKEARIVDMARIQEGVQKSLAGEPRAQLTPMGETKTILGRSCTGYTANIAVPMKMGDDQVNLLMTGPIWIAVGAPGSADYTGFYSAAAQNGLFFGNPDQAKGSGGAQMRGVVEMYRKIAELGGVTYESDLQTKFEGSGMMAAMMNKVGGFTLATIVKSVSTDAIPDAMFEVPAGYTTKTK